MQNTILAAITTRSGQRLFYPLTGESVGAGIIGKDEDLIIFDNLHGYG